MKKTEETGTPQAAIDSNQKKMNDTNSVQGKTTMGENISPDFKFAVDAADGGIAEVKMGELAEKNGSDKAVKEFGKRMVTDHTNAGNELKAIAEKKHITLPRMMGDKNQKHYDDLSRKTGADFDKAYMDMMVSDHKSDIGDFEVEVKNGKDPELKEWASKTLPTLRHHLDMAQKTNEKVAKTKPTAGK